MSRTNRGVLGVEVTRHGHGAGSGDDVFDAPIAGRKKIADYLRMAEGGVRYHEGAGNLRLHVDDAGTRWARPSELDAWLDAREASERRGRQVKTPERVVEDFAAREHVGPEMVVRGGATIEGDVMGGLPFDGVDRSEGRSEEEDAASSVLESIMGDGVAAKVVNAVTRAAGARFYVCPGAVAMRVLGWTVVAVR